MRMQDFFKNRRVRFQSPALNEVFSYKTDTAYLYFWSAMGIPEEQIDAKRIIIDNEVMTELNQELTADRKRSCRETL